MRKAVLIYAWWLVGVATVVGLVWLQHRRTAAIFGSLNGKGRVDVDELAGARE